MAVMEVKGARIRTDALRPESLAYLRAKQKRLRRREDRGRNPLHGLFQSLLPSDYQRVPVESLLRGRVLVVGCSGGLETIALRAVGVDIDRPALSIAADLSRHSEAGPASFLAASAAELPFRTACFDTLLSDNVVEHLPDGVLQRHLREARRILRSGGVYVFTSPNRLYEIPPKEDHVSLHSYAEWEVLLRDAGYQDLKTPRRRSGPATDLSWKKDQEIRASKALWKLGISNRGLRLVTILAET